MAWREDFSVGIPEIDEQHKILTDCIALVQEAVTTRQRWSAVHSALGRLAQFAQIHFAVEESLMRIHDYPRLAAHAAEHRQFSSELKALQEDSLRVDVSAEMIAFLHGWLEQHVRTSDRHYVAHCRQSGVKDQTGLFATLGNRLRRLYTRAYEVVRQQ